MSFFQWDQVSGIQLCVLPVYRRVSIIASQDAPNAHVFFCIDALFNASVAFIKSHPVLQPWVTSLLKFWNARDIWPTSVQPSIYCLPHLTTGGSISNPSAIACQHSQSLPSTRNNALTAFWPGIGLYPDFILRDCFPGSLLIPVIFGRVSSNQTSWEGFLWGWCAKESSRRRGWGKQNGKKAKQGGQLGWKWASVYLLSWGALTQKW